MEMQQVRYFLAVSRTLNFTRAADECNVSQPALTRAIQALEAELGGELLRRERLHSHLTELGQRMLPLLQQCYDSAMAAKALAVAIKKGEVQTLSIAVSLSVPMGTLAHHLSTLTGKCKGLRLKVHRGTPDQIAELLKSGQVELAVAGSLEEAWERLDRWQLFSEPFTVVLNRAHKFSNLDRIGIDHAAGEPILINRACEGSSVVVAHLADKSGRTVTIHEVESEPDLIDLLEANLGISIAPASTVRTTNLRAIELDGLAVNRTVLVYSVAGRQRSQVCTTLLNLLRAADWSKTGANRPT